MKKIYSIMVCVDCHDVINDNVTSLDYHYNKNEAEQRLQEINEGIKELNNDGFIVHNNSHDEFSTVLCECCGSKLHGERFGYDIIK